jgi:hypothetical protein
VNELYDVVLEGLEEGGLRHVQMGVYERIEGKEVNGRGVWQKLDKGPFLYCGNSRIWVVGGNRENMDDSKSNTGCMFGKLIAATRTSRGTRV